MVMGVVGKFDKLRRSRADRYGDWERSLAGHEFPLSIRWINCIYAYPNRLFLRKW